MAKLLWQMIIFFAYQMHNMIASEMENLFAATSWFAFADHLESMADIRLKREPLRPLW